MAASLSVTTVSLAYECPRLLYLGHHLGGKTLFSPGRVAAGIGHDFHWLSAQCVGALRTDRLLQAHLAVDVSQIEFDRVTQHIQQTLYESVFYPFLQEKQQEIPGSAPALLALWQSLQLLIQQWAQLLITNRQFCTADTVLTKTFIAQELSIQHEFVLPDGRSQRVRGRCDGVVYDFEKQRLCVVEYKTYTPPDPTAQLVQVALYSYMLQHKIGVPINSAVYNVLPDWQETTYDAEDLATSLHQLLPAKLQQIREWLAWQPGDPDPPPPTPQPGLCELCPQRSQCQTFFESDGADSSVFAPSSVQASGPRPTPAVAPAIAPRVAQPKPATQPRPQVTAAAPASGSPPTANQLPMPLGQSVRQPALRPSPAPSRLAQSPAIAAEPATPPKVMQLGQKLTRVLRSFNVKTRYEGAAIAPAFIRIKLKPELGVKVQSILRLVDDLQVQMDLPVQPLIAPQAGYVSVDLPRSDRQVAAFADYVQPSAAFVVGDEAAAVDSKIALGIDLEGQLIEADLADANTCHFLVGGTTGSGKSEFLRSLLLSLLVRYPPAQLKIVLVDPKRITFSEFANSPWLYQPIVKDSDPAIALMQKLVTEMERRYRLFEQHHCVDLTQFNRRSPTPLPRLVCIFDEYADLMVEKETRLALEQSIKRLG
ncbi:MAG: DNA translocase FtsK, partial [Cyanobacteria bacterium P01_H01_bin.121]